MELEAGCYSSGVTGAKAEEKGFIGEYIFLGKRIVVHSRSIGCEREALRESVAVI